MSGFDPDWLALREPADHAARNADVLAACKARFAGRKSISVVDLGCGAGSNLRALAPHLPRAQHWRLVDHDSALLHAARERLAEWADAASPTDGGLLLRKDGKDIHVELHRVDLARDLDAALGGGTDLVTAAALFDLASETWMRDLCARLAGRGAPLYATLIYDGQEEWSPAHPADAEMQAAFHAHQNRDKGFGPAAGPRAASILSMLLRAKKYALVEGRSDWKLGASDILLLRQLADGIASACAETGLVDPAVVARWRHERRNASARIGHIDLFAAPAEH
jgi:hypothetical protein